MLNLIFAGDSQFLPSLQAVNPSGAPFFSRGHDGRHHAGARADFGVPLPEMMPDLREILEFPSPNTGQTELDDGKIYRQPLYLMLKNPWVSGEDFPLNQSIEPRILMGFCGFQDLITRRVESLEMINIGGNCWK
jgi:hypothetical protein